MCSANTASPLHRSAVAAAPTDSGQPLRIPFPTSEPLHTGTIEACRIVYSICPIPVICRSFFQQYLPKSFQHQAKKDKMVNAGVVAFTLNKILFSGKMVYAIPQDSISVIHGGFEDKKKKKA